MGCSEQGAINPISESSGVGFNYTLSGVYSQSTSSRAGDNVISKLIITDLINSNIDTVDWFITLDKSIITISSNMTYTLKPGSYRFELEIVDGDQRYIGTAEKIINDTDQLNIPLNVAPVIGDIDLNVEITNLPKLTFQYPVDELATLTAPKVGYKIDNGTETIIALNKASGASDVYLNIPEGDHEISLKLYDGDKQVGKSKNEQETVTIVANSDIRMDLIPLHGEVMFILPVNGAAGVFNISIPAEVVTEAGSLSNLKTTFQLSTPRNGSHESDIVLTLDNGRYIGSVTFDPLSYDSGSASITFIDISKNELLATALFPELIISESGTTLSASIELIRRAIISGNIQAVIGVNVFDENHDPVLGAKVYVDDVFMGLTGSAWGTQGYLKFYHNKGNVTLKASTAGAVKDSAIVLSPLAVENYNLILEDHGVYNSAKLIVRTGKYGYSPGSRYSVLTSFLDSNVTNTIESSSLVDPSWVSTCDALLINYYAPELTTEEITNIRAFLKLGKRVVVLGDRDSWSQPWSWNENILSIVENNAATINSDIGGTLQPYTKDIEHELTLNADTIALYNPTSITGGKSLYGGGCVALFGDSENLLYIMDSGGLQTVFIGKYSTYQFMRNMVKWLTN